jgi:hypothetical protein
LDTDRTAGTLTIGDSDEDCLSRPASDPHAATPGIEFLTTDDDGVPVQPLATEVNAEAPVDEDLVALRSEHIAGLDTHRPVGLSRPDLTATHHSPAVEQAVVTTQFGAEVFLLLSQVVGSEQLTREIAHPLQVRHSTSVTCHRTGGGVGQGAGDRNILGQHKILLVG